MATQETGPTAALTLEASGWASGETDGDNESGEPGDWDQDTATAREEDTRLGEPGRHGSGGSHRLGRAFLGLRIASAVSIVSAAAIIIATGALDHGWQAWVPTIAVLGYMGVAVEAASRWTQRVVLREKERTQEIHLDREARLQHIASRDDLTQLQNRRVFYERLQEELDRATRTRKEISIVMIDVDDLKALNDEFGHQVGDVILRQFGRILNQTTAEGQVTARLGGDEFAVIMPGAGRREADQLAWRLWDKLAESPIWENKHASIYLGVSVGVGGYPWGGTDLEDVIHWADAKLYANKLERKGFDRGRRTAGSDNRLSSAVVEVLSTALDIRDNMTHRHARRVARMAAAVAKHMVLNEQQVLEIEYAAALHDIGKIGVADSILRKAAPLDADEWKDMRRHSELGYEILNGIDFLKDAAEIVWAHHERYDGTGYPRGLSGEEIPLGSRVFGVVDAYDAMTSKRPYRLAMTREEACAEVAKHSGTQFDPVVVDSFLAMIVKAPEGMYEENDPYGPTTHTHDNEHDEEHIAVLGA